MLSACDRLLLAAAAPGTFTPAELVRRVRGEEILWPQALRLAAANRVSSCVTELVEAEPLASCVGSAVRAEWRALRMLQVFRAEAAQRQLRELGEVLGRAGVAPIVYKGLDFQARCYSEAHPRAFEDLDIVVRREDAARGAAALEAAGYCAPPGALPLDYHRRFHLHASYVHPAHRLCVELHWALDSPFADRLDPIPLLFAAAERGGPFGPDVLRPAPIDALALMAIHLEKHLGLSATLPGAEARLKSVIDQGGLIWVLDVVRWMRTQAVAAEGDAVLRRIRELGAERSLVIALRLARDLDPASLRGWAGGLAVRLPCGRPLLSRLVYPDLGAGQGVTERGRQRRAFLLSMQPRLGFRPVRVLEALLPPFRVPGTAGRSALAWSALGVRRLARLAANLVALRRSRAERRGSRPAGTALRWTLGLYLLLGLVYSVSVPPWEGSDEPSHYRLALQFARGVPRPTRAENYEASQPALYYWLAAWPLRLLERISPALVEERMPPLTPQLRAAPPEGAGGTAIERLRRHDAFDGQPVFDWNPTTYRVLVGVHVLRWFGLGLGALAVLLIHRAGLRLAPDQPGIAAGMAALVALTPQFLHVQTILSNDALANLAGAFLFWLLIGVGVDGPERPRRLAGAVLAALALPFLTKLTLLPLSLATLLCVAGVLRASRVGRGLGRHTLELAAVLALLALAVALAPSAGRAGLDALVARAAYVRPGALAEVPAIWSSLARSYWGTVGWMSIELPARAWLPLTFVAGAGAVVSLRLAPAAAGVAYWRDPGTILALGVALVVAILANDWLANAWFGTSLLLLQLSHQRSATVTASPPRPWRIVALCVGLALCAVLKNALATLQAQGRYLLPSAGALAAAAVAGWMILLPAVWRPRLPVIILAAMTALNVLMLVGAIWPAYYQPFLDGLFGPP